MVGEDEGHDTIVEVGEVETEVRDVLLPGWRAGASASKTHPGGGRRNFRVYVPVGQEVGARRLLDEHGIEFGSVRTWSVIDGYVVITPVATLVDAKDHR